jgi:recombination endonuclease VII
MFSHSARRKQRFAEDADYREKIRAAWRRYREAHRDKINERRRLRWRSDAAFRDKNRKRKREFERRKRYRISREDYEAMVGRQNGACAICKRATPTLFVDHCHACGKVRGLLCLKCNTVLGFCADSVPHLLAAIAYLRASCEEAPASSVTTSEVPGETEWSRASADRHHCRCAGKAL